MNIEAIILARGGSKGIPKKNIMNFCGKPLIQWTIENCINSKLIDRVTVSSDDEEILDVVRKINNVNWIKRPIEISQDDSSSEQAINHWLNNGKNKIDYVVFPQVTSPLRTSEDIDNALKIIIDTEADSLFSASNLDDFCVWDDQGKSITYDYKNRGRRQNKKPCYLENGSIYIFKSDGFNVEQNRLFGKMVKYIMPFWKSYEIDCLDDIEICEYYMKRKIIND